jgi:DNA-binding NtrC family response regulator
MVRLAVIDDDPDLGPLIADAVALLGWETDALTSTDGLLEHLGQQRPDVILLDIWLEGSVSGWDLLAALAQDAALKAIPVIVSSAAIAEPRVQEAWFGQRGILVLEKPFNLDDVYQVVESVLSRAQTSAE